MRPAKISASLSEVARHFGISRTAARDLEIQNIINRAAGLDACRLAYIQHIRERRSRSAADDAYRRAKAREVELRIAERLHKLCLTEEMMAAFEDVVGVLLTELSCLPAAVTRDLQLRRQIEEKIFTMRARVAHRFEAQARSLQKRGKAAA
jgi:hypothetical protein